MVESKDEWRMTKMETQIVVFTVCFEYILRLVMLSFQPGIDLASRKYLVL